MTRFFITGRRKSRIANAVFFFVSGFGYAAWASRIPTIRHELQLSDSMLGALLFAMPAGLICTLPITQRLLRRYSSNSIMLAGSLGFSVALALTGFVSAVWQLALLLFCFGSTRNLLNISMNAQAVTVQRMYKKKSVITAFHGVWSIAGFAGAALGYVLVQSGVGIVWHFPAVGLVIAGLSLWQFRRTISEKPKPQPRRNLFSVPKGPMRRYALIVFLCMACENTMYDWSGVYFQKTVGAGAALSTAAFAAYIAMMTAGRFAGDRIVTHIGVRQMLLLSAALLTTGFAIAVLFPYAVTGFLGFMMAGFGVSCISPLVFSLAGKTTRNDSAGALASISSVSYIGFLVVPPLVGFLSEAAGIRVSFGIVGTMAFAMLLLIRGIEKDAHHVSEHPEEPLM